MKLMILIEVVVEEKCLVKKIYYLFLNLICVLIIMSEFIPLSEGRESQELKAVALKLKLNNGIILFLYLIFIINYIIKLLGLADSDIDKYYEAFKMLVQKDANHGSFITAKSIFELYLNNNLVPDSMTLEDCSNAINIFSSNKSRYCIFNLIYSVLLFIISLIFLISIKYFCL
jgi:hypothetical protein